MARTRTAALRRIPTAVLLTAALLLAILAAACGAGDGAAPHVDAVRPAAMPDREGGLLIITGRGFQQGARVLVGSTEAGSVTWVNQHTLTAVVARGSAAGHHQVRVVNPDGTEAAWDGALSIFQVPTPVPTPRPTATPTPTPTERPGRDDRDENGRGRGNRGRDD
ncbi:MAG TPA: IPT/TIG domain-containing protein [Dehalococcoidia bacterium]